MKTKKTIFLYACIALLLSAGLQGCNATTGKSKHDSSYKKIDKKRSLASLNKGLKVDLYDLIRGYGRVWVSYYDNKLGRKRWKLIKKPLQVIQADFIRQSVLKTSRGQSMKNCQFVAARVELDRNIETAEWLATTKGSRKCSPAKKDIPRNYWLIQQDNNQSGKSLLDGRAYNILITGFAGGKAISWADIHTENSTNIRGADVICYDHYEMQDGYYHLINKRVEAYKPTGSMLNSHTPEMYWETVTDNPEYQCPSG